MNSINISSSVPELVANIMIREFLASIYDNKAIDIELSWGENETPNIFDNENFKTYETALSVSINNSVEMKGLTLKEHITVNFDYNELQVLLSDAFVLFVELDDHDFIKVDGNIKMNVSFNSDTKSIAFNSGFELYSQ